MLVAAAVLLSGFGIYLGRFLRWNSWDTVTSPRQLSLEITDRVMNPLSHPQTVGVTVVYGVGLFLGYVALRFWQPATHGSLAKDSSDIVNTQAKPPPCHQS